MIHCTRGSHPKYRLLVISIVALIVAPNNQLPFLAGYLRTTTIPNTRFPPQRIHILFALLRPLQHQMSAQQVSMLERVESVLGFVLRSELEEGETA